MAVKFLIGGSPCTHWSIAQKTNRETEPSDQGWELFKNFLIAKEKFKPDFFLYENNKSMAKAIKEQITNEFGVEPYLINSALVSAQNRQRYYWTNIKNVPQPEDRGILLKDILETGTDISQNEKSYCMTASYNGAVAWNTLERNQRTMVADPVRVGCYPSPDGTLKNSQAMRLYSIEGKSVNLTANGGGMGAKTGLYAIPVESQLIDYTPRKNSTIKINNNAIRCSQNKNGASVAESFVNFTDVKAGTLTTAHVTKIIEKIETGELIPTKAVSCADGKEYPVYEVKDGQITIREKQYPIKLIDGYYIIRKLTVTECCRLQTLPDDYCRAVSNTQGYKGLGNGWTAEVIIHILKHANVPLDEEIIVLSLYDGIGTGRYCFDKMGYTNVKYYAYEIDKFPIQVAQSNYPDIVQCGDAFAVREDSWRPPKTRSEWLDELLGVSNG